MMGFLTGDTHTPRYLLTTLSFFAGVGIAHIIIAIGGWFK